jgi:hypothetical protein
LFLSANAAKKKKKEKKVLLPTGVSKSAVHAVGLLRVLEVFSSLEEMCKCSQVCDAYTDVV